MSMPVAPPFFLAYDIYLGFECESLTNLLSIFLIFVFSIFSCSIPLGWKMVLCMFMGKKMVSAENFTSFSLKFPCGMTWSLSLWFRIGLWLIESDDYFLWIPFIHFFIFSADSEELFPVASSTTFFTGMHHILKVMSSGNARTACHHRLRFLEEVSFLNPLYKFSSFVVHLLCIYEF